MLKKYLPIIFLVAAGALFFWVKTNQRGTRANTSSNTKIKVPIPAKDVQGNAGFDRGISHIEYTKHALCRMDCRHIDEFEVKEILKKGKINYSKVEEDERGKTYPLEGITRDKQNVRVIVAPQPHKLVIVTAIDLDTEWQCNCQ